MSKPTPKELRVLKKPFNENDHEAYHGAFDKLLEAKLMQLDPEWMTAMQRIYAESDMMRWCA